MNTSQKILLSGLLSLSLVALGAQCNPNRTQSSQNSGTAWYFNGSEWQPTSQAKECSGSVIQQSPTDISLVTSILYPGQTRGGNYKPHGGFRFDHSSNSDITVVAPFDADLFEGSRYLVNGEVQYTFDFISPCGHMYRLGHLLTLTPTFQTIAEQFPEPRELDSRTTFVEPPVKVAAGTVIATAVGVTSGNNTFFDFGVYDLHQKNEASQNPNWNTTHGDDQELAPYAVCWFDLLPTTDAEAVKALPAGDTNSGTTSDYCK